MRSLLIGVTLTLSVSCYAGYFQAPLNQIQTQNLELRLESGDSKPLNQILNNEALAGRPVLLVPAYFDCSSTCPLLAENLRDAFKKSKKGATGVVLFVSFNSDDSKDSMNMFRKHHRIPAEWLLAVASQESQARDFFGQFNYQFQKTKDGFDHPNLAFMLSKEKRIWTGMIAGTDSTPDDIDRAIGESNYAELGGFSQKVVRVLKQPEYLMLIGFVGVVLPLIVIIFTLARRRKSGLEIQSI